MADYLWINVLLNKLASRRKKTVSFSFFREKQRQRRKVVTFFSLQLLQVKVLFAPHPHIELFQALRPDVLLVALSRWSL
ncbi:hypothetical protein E4T58_06475 [Salmonella enterica subsp. enterica serovar Infantis]|nr:hypothetical protein E4T58_06475 [Salmonella enterica subsp. enterica serovar Infantis]